MHFLITENEFAALRLAIYEHRERQGEIAPETWESLILRGLATHAESEDGETWIELTEEGCCVANRPGEPRYLYDDECFSCAQAYVYIDEHLFVMSTCPKCG